MRVVHAHRISGIGGSERHLLTLLPALQERGVDVTFVGLDVAGAEADAFYERLRVPAVRVENGSGISPRLVRELRAARPDIVHTHLVHADLHGALAPRPLVTTKHNDDPFRTGPWRHVERVLTRRAARVICITEALKRFNVERVGLPAAKLDVVHYGLDAPPEAWGENPHDAVPAGARVLLAISRLVPQKGLDVAVAALAHLEEGVLVVLGDGGERERLRAQARALGVDGRLIMPGRAGDVASWLSRAEVFVHPARWEGFGLVLLEAMLSARPVVASRVSAIPEIVTDGETGTLVPPDDPIALARAIGALLGDAGRARSYGAAGLKRAREQFSVDRMATQTIGVYEKALRTTASAHDSTE